MDDDVRVGDGWPMTSSGRVRSMALINEGMLDCGCEYGWKHDGRQASAYYRLCDDHHRCMTLPEELGRKVNGLLVCGEDGRTCGCGKDHYWQSASNNQEEEE